MEENGTETESSSQPRSLLFRDRGQDIREEISAAVTEEGGKNSNPRASGDERSSDARGARGLLFLS